MSRRFEIQILSSDGDGSPMTLIDRCTLDADDLIGAADAYAALFDRSSRGFNRTAAASLASCGHPRNADGECDCSSWPERAPADPDTILLQSGYDAARRAHGDRYADYLIRHDAELAAKGRALRPWPGCLQGNDGD